MPESLDAALLGEGRIDVQVFFANATREQCRSMWLRFFPGDEAGAGAFAAALPDGVLPPAAIQEHLVIRAHDPERALAEVNLLAERGSVTAAPRTRQKLPGRLRRRQREAQRTEGEPRAPHTVQRVKLAVGRVHGVASGDQIRLRPGDPPRAVSLRRLR